MKAIRIALVNWWKGFVFEDSAFFRVLSPYFKILVVEENPDFVIASVFGDVSNALRYSCPRILFTAEPVLPDFTLFDYAIGWNEITILDRQAKNRYFRYPIAFIEWHSAVAKQMEHALSKENAEETFRQKNKFCCFLSGHDSAKNERSELLSFFSKYKKIDSLGTWMTNVPEEEIVYYGPEKMKCFENYKFSLVIESFQYPGFVTEKILDALAGHTIPIYLGDPLVGGIFNKKAFIDINDYDNLEDVLKKVRELDEDDVAYLQMLLEPPFAAPNYYTSLLNDYENFLKSIFEQNPADAFRRPLYYNALDWEKRLTHKWPARIHLHTFLYRKAALAWWHVRHAIKQRRKKKRAKKNIVSPQK